MGVWFYSSSVRKWRPNACKVGKQNSKETHGVIVGKKAFNSLRNPHHNSIQAIQRVHRLQRLSATGSAATSLRAHSRCPPRGRQRHRTVRSGERPGSLRVLAQLLERAVRASLSPSRFFNGSHRAGLAGSVCLGQTAEKEVPARSGACRLPGPRRSNPEQRQVASGSRRASAPRGPFCARSLRPRGPRGARLRPARPRRPARRPRPEARAPRAANACAAARPRAVGPAVGSYQSARAGEAQRRRRRRCGVGAGPGILPCPCVGRARVRGALLLAAPGFRGPGRAARRRCARRPGCRRRGPRWCCGCPSWTCSPR